MFINRRWLCDMRLPAIAIAGLLFLSAAALTEDAAYKSTTIETRLASLIARRSVVPLQPLVPESKRNNPAMFRLGMELFFSKSLSGDFDTACASCHHPFLGGGDDLSLPVGSGAYEPDLLGPGRWHDWRNANDLKADGGPNVPRNSPTTFNSSLFQKSLFHDGRVFVSEDAAEPYRINGYRTPDSNLWLADPGAGTSLLATQTRFPIVSAEEMRGRHRFPGLSNESVREALVARLRGATRELKINRWPQLFKEAFPDYGTDTDTEALINFDTVQQAIAFYQESQVLIDSPWQRYLLGDKSSLTEQDKQGAVLFFAPVGEGGAGCAQCHRPPLFSDESYHNIAVPQFGRGKNPDASDFGRYAVTRNISDRYRFRTPSLLNVEITAPYGHSGAFVTLEAMIRHHLDPAVSLANFDFSFQDNAQMAPAGHLYAHSRALSMAVLQQLQKDRADGLDLLPAGLVLGDADVDALAAFLRSLTDPCARDRDCLSHWVPAVSDPAPDEHRLVATFSDYGPPPHALRKTRVSPKGIPSLYIQIPAPADGADAPNEAASQGAVVPARLFVRTNCAVADAKFPADKHDSDNGEAASDRLFVEIAKISGIDGSHALPWHYYSLRTAQRMLFSGGLAVGDINNDCLPDIFLPTGTGLGELYLNTGQGSYRNASKQWALDKLANRGQELASNGALMGDLEGDGDLDLIVGYVSSTWNVDQVHIDKALYSVVSILRNEGDHFVLWPDVHIDASLTSWSFALADYDNDGDLDLMTTHWRGPGLGGGQPNHLWRNDLNKEQLSFKAVDGEAGLEYMTGETDFTFTGTFADMSGDGLPDIVMAADFESSQYFLNTGKGFVRSASVGRLSDENGMGSAVGDYDNDGDLDWFVSSIWDADGQAEGNWGVSGNRLYRNEGGVLNDQSGVTGVLEGYWAWGACFADFNNDMWLDLFHVSGFDLPVQLARQFAHPAAYGRLKQSLRDFEKTPSRLYMADAAGSFVERAESMGIDDRLSGRAVVCFDHDRDGDLDILISNHNAVPLLYRNLSREGGKGNFINLSLTDPDSSNRHAIGAKVIIKAGGQQQMRELQAGGSFLSGGPPELHFGLGEARLIEEVRVIWPGPLRQQSVFENVSVNHFLKIEKQPSL